MSGRPRDPGVDDAILRATMDLVEENGYRAVSIEGIAARAGISKQTVYRRYRSKGEVILDALAAFAAGKLPVPDTGTLHGDLTELLTATFAAQQGISGTLNRALAAEAVGDETFARTAWERLILPRRDVVRSLLARARKRGELAHPDDDFLIDLVYGPMWYRLLFEPAALDADYARRTADAITALTSAR
ncbi:TetR/AcrR family transcriptional regulator [Microtetraspora malaysiensis]|uniref:TetR/AcrR family transcriptional regulator n=1 Tax=Microtetraspora malaysiensis TaxID=161358 RepID=A0ABW6SKQ9_9ACTN